MSYSIGKTPAIDEIVIKTLIIPLISPDFNPLDALEIIRDAIKQVLNKDLPQDDKFEITKYYETFSPSLLKAALRAIESRITYATALDEYLELLYRENVGTDPDLTPHTQVESTPRFHFDEIDKHLKFYLLQGTDDDVTLTGQTAQKTRTKNVIEKSLEGANITSFLIADRFATNNQFRKSSGALNIGEIAKVVSMHAQNKYGARTGQGASSIRDRLSKGVIDAPTAKR